MVGVKAETGMAVSATKTTAELRLDEGRAGSRAGSQKGEPTWEVARMYPLQGEWTEESYLAVRDTLDGLVELSDGCLEFLPMTVPFHQDIVKWLLYRLDQLVTARKAGHVYPAPLTIRLGRGKYREPDIVFLKPERITDRRRRPEGADLAIEVVSPGDEARERDLDVKRREYAAAGVSEYWIVDPETRTIHVLTLDGVEAGGPYRVHGDFKTGETATSLLIPGFAVSVDECFAAGEGKDVGPPADGPG